MLPAILIFVATIALVIWQPKGLGIGWSAMGGAAVALARVGSPQAGAGFDALSETGQAPAVRSRARCRNRSEETAQTRA